MAFRPSFSTFVALSLALGGLAAIGPVADLHIVNDNIAPDGFSRDVVLAGGTFPGPLITGHKGDNFKLNVIDDLTEASMLKSTSIHWHGFFQKGTNWADGPAFVNQCPITTQNSFLYNFDVPDQAGTYWYHSHLSTQYCDGLRGAFVVYDNNDPHASLYDVDDDSTVITLADWYHTLAREIVGVAISDSTLINGLGRYQGGPADAELAVITVQAGKRYRFRLVSISCDPNWVFSIDNHNFTVIEVDGVNSQPLGVDSIQIFAAQRYSFVLAANQPVGNYWIRANPNLGPAGFSGGINSAILRYQGAPVQEPTTSQTPSANPLREADLHPLVATPVVCIYCVNCLGASILISLSSPVKLRQVVPMLSRTLYSVSLMVNSPSMEFPSCPPMSLCCFKFLAARPTLRTFYLLGALSSSPLEKSSSSPLQRVSWPVLILSIYTAITSSSSAAPVKPRRTTSTLSFVTSSAPVPLRTTLPFVSKPTIPDLGSSIATLTGIWKPVSLLSSLRVFLTLLLRTPLLPTGISFAPSMTLSTLAIFKLSFNSALCLFGYVNGS
ncbi:unnamed protein product [Somion occarium]|uniref:laccase n=1 Tax=Somion occarium TaxID=3059160 RepID=A0ABP1DSN2_9APHY